MERKPAVAVVFHHNGPYHHARLNAAAERLSVTGIEWSAKGYDAWDAAATSARYHKLFLFPEATDHYPGKTELRRAFIAFQYFAGRLNSASLYMLHSNDKVIRTRAITFIIAASASRWKNLLI
jgi:hypothetical protein